MTGKKLDERDTRIEDTPAVPNEPTDRAEARGRDVSLRYEGGHSPENHTVVLERYWKPPTDRSGHELRRQVVAEEVVVNYTTEEQQWCWRCRRGILETVIYHKVSLERIRDRTTAKEPVVRIR